MRRVLSRPLATRMWRQANFAGMTPLPHSLTACWKTPNRSYTIRIPHASSTSKVSSALHFKVGLAPGEEKGAMLLVLVVGLGLVGLVASAKMHKDRNTEDPMTIAVMEFLLEHPKLAKHLKLTEKGLPERGFYTNVKYDPSSGFYWDFTLRIKETPEGDRPRNASVAIAYDENPDSSDSVAMQYCIVDMPHIMERFIYDFDMAEFRTEPLTSYDLSMITKGSQYFNQSTAMYWVPAIGLWPAIYAVFALRRGYRGWLPKHFQRKLIPKDYQINNMLGAPIKAQGVITGVSNEQLANFTIPVTGSVSSGQVVVQGRSAPESWVVNATLKVPGRKDVKLDFKHQVDDF